MRAVSDARHEPASEPEGPVEPGRAAEPERTPEAPVTDDDRQRVINRIQRALANDEVAFEELDERFEQVFAAETTVELEAAVAGLPVAPLPRPVPARHIATTTRFSLLGDTRIGGWISLGRRLTAATLIGDIVIDLSSAALPTEGFDLTALVLIGDVKVIVPDGAAVELTAFNLIGNSREQVVVPMAGAPTIRLSLFGAIGDSQVYSLSQVPEGKLRRLWRALRRPSS